MKKSKLIYLVKNENTSSDVLNTIYGFYKVVDRLVAQHPNASTELLSKLADHKDKFTRKYAVIHPNFSPNNLVHLPYVKPVDLIYSPALLKMSPVQLSELFGLIGKAKLRVLLKADECPTNVILWALEVGSNDDRLLIARRKYLPSDVKEQLLAFGGEIADSTLLPRGIVISRSGQIIGNFQEDMDIHNLDKSNDLFDVNLNNVANMHTRRAQSKMQSTPEPDRYLANNHVVEFISLYFDDLSINSLVLENLSKLRFLYIYGDVKSHRMNFNWLICKNLPALEKIYIRVGVKGVELYGLTHLRSIELNGCELLAQLDIHNSPNLQTFAISNCLLLREVGGLDVAQIDCLKVVEKIREVQAQSNINFKLKFTMTFTEIDAVLETINKGYKLAVRNNLFQKSDEGDGYFCYGRETDPNFHPFSFRKMSLSETCSNICGTIYYELRCHNYINGQYGVWRSIGCTNPEDCLEEALQTVVDLTTGPPSPDRMLEFFVELLAHQHDKVNVLQ